jgi:hypothetical protein
MITVLIAISAAQLADLVTFLRLMMVHGPKAEANPLVSTGVDGLGAAPLIVAKLALVVLVAATFAIMTRRGSRAASLVVTAATVAGLIGAYSNVLAL